MHIGLIIGKKNSQGLPGKNMRSILGRPCAEYAFIAAQQSLIDRIYVSSDSEDILKLGSKYGAYLINRPIELAQSETLTEDVLTHAYHVIKADLRMVNIKTITLLFCNNPAIDVNKLNDAINYLTTNDEYDSCFSVVKYNMFSPTRARKVNEEGEIKPFINLSNLGHVSSIRDSQGDVYYCDLSIQVMKPGCLENINEGQLPFKWQGKRSKAIEVDFGFDIDAEWQVPVIEYWLNKNGYSETTIPWDNK